MPAKPNWHGRLEAIIADLEALPSPWVTRGTVEFLLGVGPRRAQQIIAPCAVERVGTSLVADRRLLIARLRSACAGDESHFEARRRQKFAQAIEQLRRNWLEMPKVMVEAPVVAVNQTFEGLPDGVELGPGRITLQFGAPEEALQKLLALAMAIGQDMGRFEEMVAPGRR